jgi:alpha-beta hydrolase superfamily lysophospholipase
LYDIEDGNFRGLLLVCGLSDAPVVVTTSVRNACVEMSRIPGLRRTVVGHSLGAAVAVRE